VKVVPLRTNLGQYIVWLGDPNCSDPTVAGGKGASLSRMVAAGLPIPGGFVVTAEAFRRVVRNNSSTENLFALLESVDVENATELAQTSRQVREAIRACTLPVDLDQALTEAYGQLGGSVAVRSSAIAEDSQAASYAGQQESYLGVVGPEALIVRVKDCWASFFSEHAIFYRKQKGSLDDAGVAVVVQRLIEPEKAGVMFTVDPIQRRRDRMVIEAVWGFGEALVSGQVTPDNYQIARSDGRVLRAFVPLKKRALSRTNPDGELGYIDVPDSKRDARVLEDAEISDLVALGARLEAFFGAPQDVEWGIADGRVYLLQSRPITTAPAGGRA
jgi:pyruvate, water dikinase